MIKQVYNSSDERMYKEFSTVTFKELSSGVYAVVKDRLDMFSDEFTSSETVLKVLNSRHKAFVFGKSGSYANFEI